MALRGRRRLLRELRRHERATDRLANGVDGGNGVYRYGAAAVPHSTFNSTNYWVDLVFNPSGTDNTKPTVTDRQPASGGPAYPVTTTVSATCTFQCISQRCIDGADRRRRCSSIDLIRSAAAPDRRR